MVRVTWSARAAANRSASDSAVQRSTSPWSSSSRIASAPGLPPGSRVSTTARPRARSASARARDWVDLPTPSPPSRVTKRPVIRGGFASEAASRFRPASSRHAEQALQPGPDPAEEAGLADRFLGDQGGDLGRHVAGGNDEVGDMLALGDRCLDRALIDDARPDILAEAGGNGDRDRPRRDQADAVVAAELDPR